VTLPYLGDRARRGPSDGASDRMADLKIPSAMLPRATAVVEATDASAPSTWIRCRPLRCRGTEGSEHEVPGLGAALNGSEGVPVGNPSTTRSGANLLVRHRRSALHAYAGALQSAPARLADAMNAGSAALHLPSGPQE